MKVNYSLGKFNMLPVVLKWFPEALTREVEGADGGVTTGAENFPGPVL